MKDNDKKITKDTIFTTDQLNQIKDEVKETEVKPKRYHYDEFLNNLKAEIFELRDKKNLNLGEIAALLSEKLNLIVRPFHIKRMLSGKTPLRKKIKEIDGSEEIDFPMKKRGRKPKIITENALAEKTITPDGSDEKKRVYENIENFNIDVSADANSADITNLDNI
jgi:hypothetical protein